MAASEAEHWYLLVFALLTAEPVGCSAGSRRSIESVAVYSKLQVATNGGDEFNNRLYRQTKSGNNRKIIRI